MVMETISAAKFKEQCLALMDSVGPEGIIITKRGKPVARLMPFETPKNHGYLIGIAAGDVGAAAGDDLFSTGAWISDEWGDLNYDGVWREMPSPTPPGGDTELVGEDHHAQP